MQAPPPEEPPPAVASGGSDPGGADLGAALVVQDTFEPGLLEGDLDELSSGDLAEQIRRIQGRRRSLERAAVGLEARRKALETRASELEQ